MGGSGVGDNVAVLDGCVVADGLAGSVGVELGFGRAVALAI